MKVCIPRAAPPLIALALCVSALGAGAQTPSPAVPCAPPTEEMSTTQLYGLWQLTLWQEGGSEARPASTGALLFERHPEHPGSVRGNLKRSTAGNDRQALVSGDVTNGNEFNLDESADGVAMDAVWEGLVTPVGCGQELRGIRRPAEGREAGETVMNFVLKKASGWR